MTKEEAYKIFAAPRSSGRPSKEDVIKRTLAYDFLISIGETPPGKRPVQLTSKLIPGKRLIQLTRNLGTSDTLAESPEEASSTNTPVAQSRTPEDQEDISRILKKSFGSPSEVSW